ncbi:hypothetical protein STEG23_027864, partial [Scotinomys teguina]
LERTTINFMWKKNRIAKTIMHTERTYRGNNQKWKSSLGHNTYQILYRSKNPPAQGHKRKQLPKFAKT